MIGTLVGANARLERLLVNVGHKWSNWRIVSSLCYRAGEHLAAKAPAECERVARLNADGLLCGSLKERMFRQMYFHGSYEPEITHLIQKLAAPGQVWFDIGANIGYYTILLSTSVGPTGQVVAFEPNPSAADFLDRSIALNKRNNVHLFRNAVSDSSEEDVVLHVPHGCDVEGGSGRASLIRQRDVAASSSVPIKTISIDGLLRRGQRPPEFVKIDVEGYEERVLAGMRETLASVPPKLIICEANQQIDSLTSPSALIKYVAEFGYAIFRIRSDGLRAYALGDNLHPRDDANLAFVHSSAYTSALINDLLRRNA